MGDVERSRSVTLDQAAQKSQNLDLRGDIERGGRLVQYEDVGTAGHGHGHHGALKLPAGNLMRIAVAERIRLRQLQGMQQFQHPRFRFRLRHQAVIERAFHDLLADAMRRVEGGRRALRHIGNARATRLFADLAPAVHQRDAVHDHAAFGDPAAAAAVAHGGEPDGGFTRARFADQPQHLAAPERDVYMIDQRCTGRGLDHEVLDGKNDIRAHRSAPCTAVRPARSQSTTRLIPTVSSAMAPAGNSGA